MNTACLHSPAGRTGPASPRSLIAAPGHPFNEREDRMKLKIIAFASALLLTSRLLLTSSLTAQASPLCAGNNACSPTDNSVTQSTTNTNTNAPVAFGGAGGQGGQGGKGGDASAGAIAGAASSSKSISGAAAVGFNSNDNRSSAKQSQDQVQVQDQDQDQSVTYINPRAPVASATAAALATSSEACMGSSSIGGQGVGFGLSFGTTWENEDCKLRKGAGLLYATGNTKAAKEMLCANETYRAAFLAAKDPCAADAPAPVAAMGPQTPEIMGMSTPVPNP